MVEKAVLARIKGRVQGVWFRAWARERATAMSLRGWVRNCADGSVEALIAGPAAAVDAMVALCKEGPPNARVEDIEIRTVDAPAELEGFEIKR